jgi:lysophospholipid acyltransferase (LPLAT)-like uncharacterized protein
MSGARIETGEVPQATDSRAETPVPGASFPTPSPAAAAKPNPFLTGTVYRIHGWRYWLLLWPVNWLLRFYYATLRVRIAPESKRFLGDMSRHYVAMAWHNRSLMIPMIFLRFRPKTHCHCLVSPSKAAAWEDALFHLLGLSTKRGSSNRRSIVALRELLHAYEQGGDIGISPDGPVGPRYQFKKGIVLAARVTKAPIILVCANSPSAWRPQTWDRHFVPLPFSKVEVRILVLENAEVFDGTRDDNAAAEYLRHKLESITDDSNMRPDRPRGGK